MYKYLTFICVGLFTYSLIATRSCVAERSHVAATAVNAASLQDSLVQYRTKAGLLVARTSAQEGAIAELRITNAAIIKDREQQLGLKDEQIEGAQNARVQLQLKFDALVNTRRRHDTVETAYHRDSSNTFIAVVTEDTAGQRTIHVADTPVVDIHLTEYTGKWSALKPFAQPAHYVSAYSHNAQARITGLESMLVIKEKPRVARTAVAVAVGLLVGLVLHGVVR